MTLDFEDGVALLRFNHPEVMNAIGADMLEGWAQAVTEIQRPTNGARCLVLTGVGRGFCAGANLADDKPTENRPRAAGSGLRNTYHPLLLTLRDLEMPIVTAVNGAAAGVGMSFAIMGDIVCASREAFFLQAFARIGLVPDGGASFLLPRLVGWGRAMELSLLAERLPAEKGRHRLRIPGRVFSSSICTDRVGSRWWREFPVATFGGLGTRDGALVASRATAG